MPIPYILTNHPGSDRSETWAKLTHQFVSNSPFPWALFNSLWYAWGLFRIRSDYRVVVLGGSSRVDLFYLILQRLWPFSSRPVIKTECLWYESYPLKQFFKRSLFRCLDKVVDRYVVYASREIDDYARVFGLPREKFLFIPYHTTVDLNELTIRKGEYLFSGGNFGRDYSTLAKAVEGLNLKVIIACTSSEALRGIRFPENVKIVSVSHKEFRRLMAESGINVLPLSKGLLHAAGQQTFLNAMAMGKPVIVTDPEGAKDYIEDGVDGILVPPSDPDRLRSSILSIHNDPDLAMRMGQAARKKAVKWDTEAHLATTVKLAQEAVHRV